MSSFKSSIAAVWVALLSMPLAACTMGDLGEAEGDTTSLAGRSGNGILQESPVRSFATFTAVAGAESRATRDIPEINGVEVEVETFADAGDAISLFMVAFNNPDACANPVFNVRCSTPDLQNPDTEASLMWSGGGDIAGNNGGVKIKSFVEVGNEPGEILFGPGYTNHDAELHFVVRSKGVAGDDFAGQVSTYGGGCDVNDCADLQFALFPEL